MDFEDFFIIFLLGLQTKHEILKQAIYTFQVNEYADKVLENICESFRIKCGN